MKLTWLSIFVQNIYYKHIDITNSIDVFNCLNIKIFFVIVHRRENFGNYIMYTYAVIWRFLKRHHFIFTWLKIFISVIYVLMTSTDIIGHSCMIFIFIWLRIFIANSNLLLWFIFSKLNPFQVNTPFLYLMKILSSLSDIGEIK